MTEHNDIFKNKHLATKYLEKIIWQGSIICPFCDSTKISKFLSLKNKKCLSCNALFNIRTKTPMSSTETPANKWLYVMYLFVNNNKPLSIKETSHKIEMSIGGTFRIIQRIKEFVSGQEGFNKQFNKRILVVFESLLEKEKTYNL